MLLLALVLVLQPVSQTTQAAVVAAGSYLFIRKLALMGTLSSLSLAFDLTYDTGTIGTSSMSLRDKQKQ